MEKLRTIRRGRRWYLHEQRGGGGLQQSSGLDAGGNGAEYVVEGTRAQVNREGRAVIHLILCPVRDEEGGLMRT